jgi:hypothetical protein
MGLGHPVTGRILSDGYPGHEHDTPTVASEDQAASVDETSALGVSDLWKKIVAGYVSHIRQYYLMSKKSGQFWVPPLRAPNHEKCPEKGRIVNAMSGVLESSPWKAVLGDFAWLRARSFALATAVVQIDELLVEGKVLDYIEFSNWLPFCC